MATDGPDPKPCDPVIYERGRVAAIVAGVPSNAMERWVKAVAELSGQHVDWHFVAGRALVKTIGNIASVRKAVDSLIHELPTGAQVAYDLECG